MNLDELIKSLSNDEMASLTEVSKKAKTEEKLKKAEGRIAEIDKKIAALQKEKDNLIKKNENRRASLLSQER